MVKALCWLLFLCALGPAAGAVSLPDRTPLGLAAQDQTGAVWATGNYLNSYALFRWQNRAWQVQSLPEVNGCAPVALTRGEDGSVYGAWQTQNQSPPQCLITVHQGVGSRVLARFPLSATPNWGPSITAGLWAGREGDVWFAGNSPILWHISSDGTVKQFPITPAEWFDAQLANPHWPHQTSSLTDGLGRRWFWQGSASGWPNIGGLRGVLIWDGKELAYHATLTSVPDQVFSTLAPLDAGHLWLAVGEQYRHGPHQETGGLYRVDIHTLTAVPVTPPEKGAFQNVSQIFRANGDWYLSDLSRQDSHSDFLSRSAVLWRQRGTHWQKCLNSAEKINPGLNASPPHPWLAVPQGVWIGKSGGLWWIPGSGGAAIWMDWRRGLSLSNIDGLFRLADGETLAFGARAGTAILPPIPPPLYPANPEVVTDSAASPNRLNELIADPRGHLWGIPIIGRRVFTLEEWDGNRWRTHISTANIAKANVTGILACDTHSRVWLHTFDWKPPAPLVNGIVIYDSANDTWAKYDSLPGALEAAALPDLKLLPNNNETTLPLFSGDGRVTYAEGTKISLYDGHIWRHWEASEIESGYNFGNQIVPEFNAAGRLEVALPDDLWEWTPETGWQQTERKVSMMPNLPLPLGSPVGDYWGYTVTDSRGAKWLVWQGDLYETWHGVWAKIAALSGPGSPFWDGRGLRDVLRDSSGHVFFVTPFTGYPDLVVWKPPVPPAPKIQITPRAEDAVTIRFSTTAAGPHWFLWRINGGAWSAPQTIASLTLTALPHGDYRVEALALDKNLQAAEQPAVAVFAIRVNPASQVAHWVHVLLVGGDNVREGAVIGLLKQPGLALPALQAARAGASEAARWWLDAAMQQIQDQIQDAAVKPHEAP